MSAKKIASRDKKTKAVTTKHSPREHGKLKKLGGSSSDDWNTLVANQAFGALWLGDLSEENWDRQCKAIIGALVGIDPKDEIEGMIATQLIAAHHSAMECYRRAMIPEQSFEGRRENLNHATKLSRTSAALLEALNRHRGKGQQKVTVEHVHVHAGGQAVVGIVQSDRGGREKMEDQPHAKQITHEPERPMWSEDTEGERVRLTSDAERSLPHARRKIAGSAEG